MQAVFWCHKKQSKEQLIERRAEINAVNCRGHITRLDQAMLWDCYQATMNEDIINPATVHCRESDRPWV